MHYLVWLLIYLYGGSMCLAILACLKQAPFWLISLNLLSVVCLFATPVRPGFLSLGLNLLLLSAFLNGRIILGRTTLSHLLVRFFLSVLILILYQLFNH